MCEEIELTDALIEAGANGPGGWNRAQLAFLGVDWPRGKMSPLHGWKRELIGRRISRADYEAFLSLRGTHRGQLHLF